MGKQLLAAAALAAAMACDSGGSADNGHVCPGASMTPPELPADYSGNFTGNWWFEVTVSAPDYGIEESDSGNAAIERRGENLVILPTCGDGSPALVTSATTLDPVCFVCPALEVEGCSHVVVTLESGTGQLDEMTGDLSIAIDGTMDICGDTVAMTLTLDGSPPVGGAAPAAAGAPQGAVDLPALAAVAARLAR